MFTNPYMVSEHGGPDGAWCATFDGSVFKYSGSEDFFWGRTMGRSGGGAPDLRYTPVFLQGFVL